MIRIIKKWSYRLLLNKLKQLAFFLLLSFLVLQQTNAQTSFDSNQSLLHLDKSFYVTGEYIWFKVYLPISYQGQSVALRISLFDSENSVHQQFFVNTEGKTTANGYFKIPFDWQTGKYQLAVSGMNTLTKENVLLMTYLNLPIYNDLEDKTVMSESGAPVSDKKSIPHSTNLKNSDSSLQIQIASTSVKTLDKVVTTIEVKDKNGNPIKASLSVVIRDWDLTDIHSDLKIDFEGNVNAQQLSEKIHFWYQSAKPIQNNLISVFSPDDHEFLYPSTDSNQKLLLEMPFFEEVKTLQFLSLIPEDIKIEQQEPSFLKSDAHTPNEYNSTIINYLQQSRLRKKIYQLYGTTESNPDFSNIVSDTTSKPLPNRTIRFADFEYFPTLPVFLKEVSTALKYRKAKKGTYVFKMFNPSPGKRVFHSGLPIFVVDGQLTRNSDFIAAIDVNEMETLDLFFYDSDLQKYFGAMGNSGIAYLSTKSKELKVPSEEYEDIFTVNGTQAIPDFPIQQTFEQEGLPLFNPLVYWHPDLRTDNDGKCDFSFRHGHDKGQFVIEVVAQTIKGEILTQQIFYEVK